MLDDARHDEIFAVILRGIIAVGLPATVMQAIASVMNIGMNMILSSFPETGHTRG